jgi:ribosomal protein S14
MNENVTISKECEEYFYVVDGIVCEFMTSTACRRAGKPERVVRKQIKCPYCTESLTEVDKNTQVSLYRKSNNNPIKAFPGQFIKMCNSCKREVGIVMAAIPVMA